MAAVSSSSQVPPPPTPTEAPRGSVDEEPITYGLAPHVILTEINNAFKARFIGRKSYSPVTYKTYLSVCSSIPRGAQNLRTDYDGETHTLVIRFVGTIHEQLYHRLSHHVFVAAWTKGFVGEFESMGAARKEIAEYTCPSMKVRQPDGSFIPTSRGGAEAMPSFVIEAGGGGDEENLEELRNAAERWLNANGVLAVLVVHLDRSSGILTLERWINALPEPKSPSKSVASDADLNPVPQCVESRFIDLNEEAPTVSSLEPFMLVAYDELTLNEAEPANDVYITESQLVHYAEGVASRLF